MAAFLRAVGTPWRDLVAFVDAAIDRGARGILAAGLGVVAGWWLYVPLHEFLHAAGCWLTGGEVTRLEIATAYGGRLWAWLFPSWVVEGGEYAGRLAGFSVGGSDLRYLATDLAPFVLTFFPGVWGLRRGSRGPQGARSLPFWGGSCLAAAFAPWLSLSGDAYEIGSILVTRVPPWSSEAVRAVLRGDDLALVFSQVRHLGGMTLGGFAVAAFLGVVWAAATYCGASWFASRCGEPPARRAGLPGSAALPASSL